MKRIVAVLIFAASIAWVGSKTAEQYTNIMNKHIATLEAHTNA